MITARENDKDFPWWLVFTASLAAYLFYRIFTNDLYTQIQTTLLKGAGITIFVTLVAFSLACAMGLLLALGSMSRHLILRQLSRFYIEIIRGIPILVLLLYVAFVLAPAMVEVRLHRRSFPRRAAGGGSGPDRGGQGARPFGLAALPPCCVPAGLPHHPW